jgi:hypothetical protein
MRILRVESKVKEQAPVTMTRPQVPTMGAQSIAVRQAVRHIKQDEKDKDDEQK